jgi:Glycosyl hydrolase family 65, N-terminal domain
MKIDSSIGYDVYEPSKEGLREALTSTGNGYFCTRGFAEWENADGIHYPGTYVHGGYNRETTIMGGIPVLNQDLVNLPNWAVVKLRIEGEEVIQRSTPSSCSPTATSTTSMGRSSLASCVFATAAAVRPCCVAAASSAWRTYTRPGSNGF